MPVLLSDPLARRARDVARRIADSLATREIDPSEAAHVALFWAYAADVWDDVAPRYDVAFERLVDRLVGEYDHYGLYGGLAGDGWVLCHLSDEDDGEAAELLTTVDRSLAEVLAASTWDGHYDLIGGLVGFGVYFLERLIHAPNHAAARAALARIVGHLDAGHIPDRDGVTWANRDCGIAHGVPGVVALLGRIAALPDPPPRTYELLEAATRWVWAQQLPPSPAGRFSCVANEALIRTAWCYGDASVAIAMWSAARRTGGSVDAALAVMQDVAVRDPSETRVEDAALCHGAVGIGWMLARCATASGDPILRDGAIRWFERALELPVPVPAQLLEGATGLGLALLSATTDGEPNWDRLLLCDL